MAKDDAAATIKKLIKQPSNLTLARKLIAHGAGAFPAALAAARKNEGDEVALLPLLRRLATPEAVPQLRKLAADERGEMASLLALELLGAAGDPAGLATLRDVLLDDEADSPDREAAALAIGSLGDPAGLAIVKQVAGELIGPEAASGEIGPLVAACREIAGAAPATVAMACIRAAACLGDHSLAPAAVAMTAYTPREDDPWDMEWGRKGAARALQVSVGAGMVPALASLLRGGKELDAQHAALLALSFLGTKDAIGHMVAAAEDKYEPIGRPAAGAVRLVAGSDGDLAGPDLVEWWKERQDDFEPDVCYRLGEPVHLPSLFDLLDDADWHLHVERDLHIQTGRDFAYESPAGAQAWWKGLKTKPEPGELYKWGRKVARPA